MSALVFGVYPQSAAAQEATTSAVATDPGLIGVTEQTDQGAAPSTESTPPADPAVMAEMLGEPSSSVASYDEVVGTLTFTGTVDGDIVEIADDGIDGDGWMAAIGASAVNGQPIADPYLPFTFRVPTMSIAVDLGGGTDLLTVRSLDSSFAGGVRAAGGEGHDCLTITLPGDLTWAIDGPGSGTAGPVGFVGFENLSGAPDNEDLFLFGPGASLSGLVDGGPRGFDTLALAGGPYESVTYLPSGPDSGTFIAGDDVFRFVGLEPTWSVGPTPFVVVDLTGSLVDPVDNTVLVESVGGVTTVSGDTLESYAFANPTSLQILLGAGNDRLTFGAL
ncbi:MAG: hypothetical protein JXA36_07040, partial [Coriobacteriia bacterium]|nr:hypothetical protein [Coriobacteriia bacterium]